MLEISGNNFTSREMAILKYVLGEEGRDLIIETMTQNDLTKASYEESEIWSRQMDLLKSITESEEFQRSQEDRRAELNLLDQIEEEKEPED